MKKITLFASAIFVSGISFGQLFSDNFDALAPNTYVGPTSTYWSTWSGTEGTTEDVKTTTNQAKSLPNSIYFASTAASGGPQDVLLKFGQLYNSGVFTLQSDFYVVAGKNAYFNLQGALTPGTKWALNVNMDGGNVTIDDGTTANLAVGKYNEGTWFNLKIEANLTLKVWKAYIDNNLVGTWINGVNSLASADFYPVQNSQYYMDNVSFDHQPYSLTNRNGMVAMINVDGEIAGQNIAPKVTVVNAGQTAINSFDLIFSYNGSTITQPVTGVNIASTANQTITLNPITLAAGNQEVTAYIWNVNNGSNDDVSSDDTLIITINPIVPAPGKMVVSEEGTGTWCQWCPRGAVYMDLYDSKYSQFWTGIAVHNGDPMTVAAYDTGFGTISSGYPSATVDRGTDVDPSDMSTDFLQRLQIPPVATIVNGANWDATTRKLDVSITANFALSANNNYKLACVLTEDGVTGSSSSYNQSNAYSGGGNGTMGGYETKANPVPASQMVYDHVARAIAPGFTGKANSFPTTVASGETHTLNFSFTLPAAWDTSEIHIIGLLIDPQGKIDNAGTATIAEAVANGYLIGGNAGLYDMTQNELENAVSLFPNPAYESTTLSVSLNNASEIEMNLVNVSGQVLATKNFNVLSGIHKFDLNTSNYDAGVYFVELTINGTKVAKRLIIE
jgi:hypothetical protein